ncbi:P-loop containing nucleoside triphosphate hydrolase protein [Ascobolus immersus RN42]|uniref:DNA 3'-5' helicase n=1 Tax=Ascobolus immersus RN42 TaxID=1160509 RepID=A0A3N4IV31_ASCIM|nr:P-loop containing nucleoside triphosphate hydrolase protein [Ascobolus immersus RN42]
MAANEDFELDEVDTRVWDHLRELEHEEPPSHPIGLSEKDLERFEEYVKLACSFAQNQYHMKLRPFQYFATALTLMGKDVIVAAGTSAGKSAIFQSVLCVPNSTLVVISPLNGLIAEQVRWFEQRGIRAAMLTADNLARHPREWGKINNGTVRVIVSSPEQLLAPGSRFWHHICAKFTSTHPFFSNIRCFAVDEVHMVKKWGKSSFRVEFRNIGNLKAHFPGTPIFGCSATLPANTRSYVHTTLRLQKPTIFIKQSVQRDNINIVAARITSKPGAWTEFDFLFKQVRREGLMGIPKTMIFVDSKKEAQTLANFLRRRLSKFLGRTAYSEMDRVLFMEDFRNGDCRILICTDAASLGMNVPNVDVVIQFGVSKFLTIGDLSQRIGRAVRTEGMTGLAVIYFPNAMCAPVDPPINAADGDFNIDFSLPVREDNAAAVKRQIENLYVQEDLAENSNGAIEMSPEDPCIKWARLTHGCRNRHLCAAFHDKAAIKADFKCAGCDNCYFPTRSSNNRTQPPKHLCDGFLMAPPGGRDDMFITLEQIERDKADREESIRAFRQFADDYWPSNDDNYHYGADGRFGFDIRRSVRYMDTAAYRQDELDRKAANALENPPRARSSCNPKTKKGILEAIETFLVQVHVEGNYSRLGIRATDLLSAKQKDNISTRIGSGTWECETVEDLQRILGAVKKFSVKDSILGPYALRLLEHLVQRRTIEYEKRQNEKDEAKRKALEDRRERAAQKAAAAELATQRAREREEELRRERDERRMRILEEEARRQEAEERLRVQHEGNLQREQERERNRLLLQQQQDEEQQRQRDHQQLIQHQQDIARQRQAQHEFEARQAALTRQQQLHTAQQPIFANHPASNDPRYTERQQASLLPSPQITGHVNQQYFQPQQIPYPLQQGLLQQQQRAFQHPVAGGPDFNNHGIGRQQHDIQTLLQLEKEAEARSRLQELHNTRQNQQHREDFIGAPPPPPQTSLQQPPHHHHNSGISQQLVHTGFPIGTGYQIPAGSEGRVGQYGHAPLQQQHPQSPYHPFPQLHLPQQHHPSFQRPHPLIPEQNHPVLQQPHPVLQQPHPVLQQPHPVLYQPHPAPHPLHQAHAHPVHFSPRAEIETTGNPLTAQNLDRLNTQQASDRGRAPSVATSQGSKKSGSVTRQPGVTQLRKKGKTSMHSHEFIFDQTTTGDAPLLSRDDYNQHIDDLRASETNRKAAASFDRTFDRMVSSQTSQKSRRSSTASKKSADASQQPPSSQEGNGTRGRGRGRGRGGRGRGGKKRTVEEGDGDQVPDKGSKRQKNN